MRSSSIPVGAMVRTHWPVRGGHVRETSPSGTSLAEQVPLPILEVDLEGRVLFANACARTVFFAVTALGTQHPALAGFEDVIAALYEDLGDSADAEVRFNKRVFRRVARWGQGGRTIRLYFEEATRLHKLQEELARTSHQASMAEVATGVLHNVGNILNGVNVSADLVHESLQASKIPMIKKAIEVLDNSGSGDDSVSHERDRPQKVVSYLKVLAERTEEERQRLLQEIGMLRDRVGHIKNLVTRQQQYAKTSGNVETCAVSQLIKEAIGLLDASYQNHQVDLTVDCRDELVATVDRHRVLQVLINLLGNAKHAVQEVTSRPREVHIIADCIGHDGFYIRVLDNGVGIAEENMSKIFAYGFTTKSNGHGFGLHNAQKSARAMGGELTCASHGHDKGASFTLKLPIKRAERS